MICDCATFDLKDEVKNLKKEYVKPDSIVEEQEQYSRRNSSLIHGLKDETNENIDEKAKNFFNENLTAVVKNEGIVRTHRLGRANGLIIAKLVRHNMKRLFVNKDPVFPEKQRNACHKISY